MSKGSLIEKNNNRKTNKTPTINKILKTEHLTRDYDKYQPTQQFRKNAFSCKAEEQSGGKLRGNLNSEADSGQVHLPILSLL